MPAPPPFYAVSASLGKGRVKNQSFNPSSPRLPRFFVSLFRFYRGAAGLF